MVEHWSEDDSVIENIDDGDDDELAWFEDDEMDSDVESIYDEDEDDGDEPDGWFEDDEDEQDYGPDLGDQSFDDFIEAFDNEFWDD